MSRRHRPPGGFCRTSQRAFQSTPSRAPYLHVSQSVEPAHSYSVGYEDRDGYLFASVSGETDTVATSLAYWNEVAREAERRGHSRILVVEDFKTVAPAADVFEVASQLPQIVGRLKVAFVDRNLEELEMNMFGETVAVNRGVYGRVFRDEEAAIRWLVSAGG